MMNENSYLIFELGHSRYGIETAAVQELFLIPDIVPIPETPTYVMGVINLRGEILPIVDLHQRLGQPSAPYQLMDNIIVLQWQHQRIGILVNQVCEVEAIATSQLQLHPADERSPNPTKDGLILGLANLGADLIILLNPETLILSSSRLVVSSQAVNYPTLNGESPTQTRALSGKRSDQEIASLFTHLPDAAQQILRARANNLRQVIDAQDSTGTPVAVIEMGGEYLGLGLEAVHEFIDIHKTTPIPCCPPHILGNINLRGEIITLIDIGHVVNLSTNFATSCQKAIIVRLDQITAGVAVDEIFDLIYLDPSQILAAPIAIHSVNDEYLQGVAPYQDKMMSIVDLSKILLAEELVVNEEV